VVVAVVLLPLEAMEEVLMLVLAVLEPHLALLVLLWLMLAVAVVARTVRVLVQAVQAVVVLVPQKVTVQTEPPISAVAVVAAAGWVTKMVALVVLAS
jgi:hypothetical protein